MEEKNTSLSAHAKAIVDACVNQNILEPHRSYAIVIELYSRRKNANHKIVSELKESIPTHPLSITEEEFAILDAEYREVVKYCHKIIVGIENSQRNMEYFHIPDELVNLLTRVIDCQESETVFLPFAGYCDMAFALDAKSVSGFEANRGSVAFSKILFDAYGINGTISSSDTFAPKFEGGEYYDHIISFPPRLSSNSKDNRQTAQYMLDLLKGGLSDGGDMCLVLPLGDLSSLQWVSFRRFLMENKTKFNVLTISLPAVFMPVTSVKYSLMFIEKRENPDGTFFFMDADRQEFFTVSKENHKQPLLKVESILESLKVRDERYVREIDVENNIFFGKHYLYSFAPSRYFVYDDLPKLEDGFEYHSLGELVENLIIPGMAESDLPYGHRPGRYVRYSCLHDNYMSCGIDYKAISSAPIPSSAYNAYANGGYAAFVNGRIKVGQISGMFSDSGRFDYYDPYSDSTIIYVDNNVAHFAPKPNGAAQLDYILRELMSDYVLEQAKKLAYGTVIQEMRHNDFFKLKIAVPSIELQDEILKQDRIDAVEKAGVKLDELNEKFRRDIHMMLHGLGQTVFNLGNWMKMLNYARKTGNGIIDEKAEIGGLVKVKGSEIFDNIDTALSVLSRQISTFDAGYRMKSTKFSLTEFLDKYIEMHKRPNVDYDFPSASHRAENDVPLVDIDDTDPQSIKAVEYPREYLLRKGDVMDYIDFSEEALQIILDCIVTNAVAHGFTNPEKKYVIRMDFEAQGSNYVLSVSNNGDPLPADKKPEEVFIWGETTGGKTHAGIGGYQIRNLMEEFGGKVELISTPNEEFTVTYKLTFTKTNLIDLKNVKVWKRLSTESFG